MKKKLLAAAVAGTLVLPGAALAASSVVITGFIKASVSHTSISNFRATGGKKSEFRLNDESSRIIFKMTEDLGGGLQAIAQVDWRVTTDAGADATAGNNWVGLRSKSWGTLTFGRHDLHYGQYGFGMEGGNTLKNSAISVFDYAKTGSSSMAVTSRTTNTVVWDSPKWQMFDIKLAYSFNPFAAEAEIGSTASRGYAWHANPRLSGKNWSVEYSYWDARPDAAAADRQRAHKIVGQYDWGSFGLSAGWHDRVYKSSVTGAKTGDSDAWVILGRYKTGNHVFSAHYAHAQDDKVIAGSQKARMYALGYQYWLSKRTNVGLSYAAINNGTGANYNFFTTGGGLGNAAAGVLAGEDPRLFAFMIRHAF